MRDFLLDIALPILAELTALAFFLAVFAAWCGIVVGLI
jgi:hypothetical protein